ncbi:MAG: hypothetical protein KGJ03_00930 [Betaproteobacteria bacterium]|nr:hypothetical protein [Betaproteobacteria bacterium]MDE1954260.1 hypothetical protein [Betaproteobacteria bacterium]MDE2150924.1 hypothetical protein [Betaproteobacteria bacterium]
MIIRVKMTFVRATLLTLVCMLCVAHAVRAQTIVRCGNSYSDAPTAGCKAVESPHAAGSGFDSGQRSEFDLDGIRLGMTVGQALQAISSRFGIAESAIGQTKTQPGTLSATTTLSYVAPHVDGPALGVRLGMDPSTSTLRVETIVIGRPWTPNERAAMRAAALRKYGRPTGAVRDGQSPFWCEQPDGHGLCEPDTPELVLFNPRYAVPLDAWAKGTIPYMGWGTLALVTTQWADARFEVYARGVRARAERSR